MRCTRSGSVLPAFACAALTFLMAFIISGLAAAAQSSSRPVNPSIERGARFKSDEQPFEMWIPKGFSRSREKKTEATEVRFLGRTGGVNQFVIRNDPTDSVDDYVNQIRDVMKENSGDDCTIETVEELSAGPYPAVILFCTGLDEKEYHGMDVLVGAFSTGTAVTEVIGYIQHDDTRKARAVEQVRWMLGTVRAPGPAGLDPFLDSRRVDPKTGIYFRSHRGFADETTKATDAAVLIHAANHREMRTRLTIEGTEATGTKGRRKQGGLLRQDVPWKIPSGETMKLTGAYYADGARGMAFVGCVFADGFCVRVCASGPVSNRDRQINICERVALALEHTDITKARAEVAAAATALRGALAKGRRRDIDSSARTLASYAFLDVARVTLAGALHRLTDEKTQTEAVGRLSETRQADVFAALLKTLKHPNTRKRDAVRKALLLALGEVRNRRAISELLKHAKRGTVTDADAAIRSLGRYREAKSKKRVTKELIRMYAKLESAGRKARTRKLHERWTKLVPAFQAALERLTGSKFESAAEASAWRLKP